jgi:hypothetical protein
MAIIPQYNADGPAMAQAPVLEQGGGFRLDGAAELSTLSGIAERLAGASPQLQEIPNTVGTYAMRGLSDIGKGIQDVGTAIYSIQKQAAEAKNYRAVYEAQVEMNRLSGEFEIFKEQNPDPDQWEPKFESMVSAFEENYMAGRDLSPAAKEGISLRMNAFKADQSVRLGMDVVKAHAKRGGEALRADYLQAVNNGNADLAVSLARYGFENNLLSEDVAARMEIEAIETVRSQNVSAAVSRANTLLMQGHQDRAREELLNAPFKTQEEKELQLTTFDTRAGMEADQNEVINRAVEEPGGPFKIARELEAKGEDGNWANYPRLTGARRQKLITELYQAHYQEREEKIKEVVSDIDNGNINNLEQAKQRLGGGEFSADLSKEEQDAVIGRLAANNLKREEQIQTLTVDAGKYDPGTDINGVVYGAKRNEILLKVSGDPRLNSVLELLEKQRNGIPLTMPEQMRVAKTEELKSIRKAEANYLIPASRIRKATTKEGLPVYVDIEAEINPTDPDYIETEKGRGWGPLNGPHIKGRRVELSQEDRIKVDEGKNVNVEDLREMNRRSVEDAKILDQLDQEMNSGQIQDEVRYDKRYGEIILPLMDKAAESVLGGEGIFPVSAEQQAMDNMRARAEQNRGN